MNKPNIGSNEYCGYLAHFPVPTEKTKKIILKKFLTFFNKKKQKKLIFQNVTFQPQAQKTKKLTLKKFLIFFKKIFFPIFLDNY